MNSTAESEQAQTPTFSELQAEEEKKKEGKEQHLRVRGILAFADIFFLEKTEVNPGAAAAIRSSTVQQISNAREMFSKPCWMGS